MENIWKWIVDESHWVFDGFGSLVVMALLGWLYHRIFGKSENGSGQTQRSGSNTTNYQSGGDMNIGVEKPRKRRP
ncbi:hypothetical protein PQR53_16555 [Paraburkholderia fungorum]|uniref:hypothetical protein n=1 Tax=Paraburkholderia fungorum TaxID=134537 RepID=UPI0038BE0620